MFMKKTSLLAVILTASLIGGAASTDAQDNSQKLIPKPPEKISPPSGQKPPPDKAHQPVPQKPDSEPAHAHAKSENSAHHGKVSVNHKGKIISVDEHALKAHLAHGDKVVSDKASSTPGDKSKEHGKNKEKEKAKHQ